MGVVRTGVASPENRPHRAWRIASMALALLLVALGSAPAAQAEGGRLVQLAGVLGCTSQGGSEECATGLGLAGAGGVAVAPDGRHAYVASNNSSSVAAFTRDRRSGVLEQLEGSEGCVSERGQDGCEQGRGLLGAFSVVVSPDGRHVYVAAFRSVAVFARNRTTGALTQLLSVEGCISQVATDGCAPGRALDKASSIAVSPDGNNVYVASVGSNAVAMLVRDQLTGALTQPGDASGCVSQGGSEGCSSARALAGAFGVSISPDGRSAYVAALEGDALGVFARDAASGALLQLPETSGCFSARGAEGCGTGAGLLAPNGASVSPDGRHVYVASSQSAAVAAFARDPDGGLAQLAGADACVSQSGSEGCATGRGLAGAFSVAVTNDGENVYAASIDGVASFVRDRDTGDLAQLPGADACTNQGGSQGCATGRGLSGAAGIAVSPDARNAYVAAGQSSAVTVFFRDPERPGIRIRVAGVPRRCTARTFTARVDVRSLLPVRSLSLRLDTRRIPTRAAQRFRVRVRARALRAGRHRLRISAVDAGGNRATKRVSFRRCRAGSRSRRSARRSSSRSIGEVALHPSATVAPAR